MKWENNISGWLALDKPEGISSARAVARVRHFFQTRKAGHAGTLDPLASGMLPIALGEATKTIPFLTEMDKSYHFTICFGTETETADREGAILRVCAHRPTDEEIIAALPHFLGEITQTPPRFSAIKQDGQPAYARARRGEIFTLAPRKVKITALRLTARLDKDHAVFSMCSGKGVYVRSLATDLAQRLGTCAHIAKLRRIHYGSFEEAQIIPLDKIEKISHIETNADFQKLNALLQPLEKVLEGLPKISLPVHQAAQLRCGQAIDLDLNQAQSMPQNALFLAMAEGQAVALTRWKDDQLIPKRVFNLKSKNNGNKNNYVYF